MNGQKRRHIVCTHGIDRRNCDKCRIEPTNIEALVRETERRTYDAWGDFIKVDRVFTPIFSISLTTSKFMRDEELINRADEMLHQVKDNFKLHLRSYPAVRETSDRRPHLHSILAIRESITSNQVNDIRWFMLGYWSRYGKPQLQDIGEIRNPTAFGYVAHKNEGVSFVAKTYCPKHHPECLPKKRVKGKPNCPYKSL